MKQFIDISNLSEDDAREYLEKVRWSNSAVCSYCHSKESYKLTPKRNEKLKKVNKKEFNVVLKKILEVPMPSKNKAKPKKKSKK